MQFVRVLLLLWLCHSMTSPNSFGAEATGEKLTGERAYEFLLALTPPVKAGDWIAFDGADGRTVETVVEVRGAGGDLNVVLEVRRLDVGGKAVSTERREESPAATRKRLADDCEYLTAVPKTVEAGGGMIDAVLVKGVRRDGTVFEQLHSRDIPLGEASRRDGAPEMKLADFGWGDAAYNPRSDYLSFDRLVAAIGDGLPAPKGGEWAEYEAAAWKKAGMEKMRLSVGANGAGGALAVSMSGYDADGAVEHLGGPEVDVFLDNLKGEVVNNNESFTLSRETLAIGGKNMPVMVISSFKNGLPMSRSYFSGELPFPWLARAFIFQSDSTRMDELRLLDWGWEEKRTDTPSSRRSEDEAREAIAAVIDAAMEKATVGDWALFATLDGGQVRYEVVDIERNSNGDQRLITLMRTMDESGKVVDEERKGNTRQEIINGYILKGGDIHANRFSVSGGEVEVKGETIRTVSITGFRKDASAYRLDLSPEVPAVELVRLYVYPASSEPVLSLVDYGRAADKDDSLSAP